MKKKICKALRELAAKLPKEDYSFNVYAFRRMPIGSMPESLGVPVKQNLGTAKKPVKHYRRLKRIVAKGDRQLLDQYLAKYDHASI